MRLMSHETELLTEPEVAVVMLEWSAGLVVLMLELGSRAPGASTRVSQQQLVASGITRDILKERRKVLLKTCMRRER